MLPWWGWVLLWAGLVLAGAGVVGWRIHWLWGRFTGFLDELDAAGTTLSAVERHPGAAHGPAEPVAVLDSPRRRAQEYAAVRRSARTLRRERRQARLPGWARRG